MPGRARSASPLSSCAGELGGWSRCGEVPCGPRAGSRAGGARRRRQTPVTTNEFHGLLVCPTRSVTYTSPELPTASSVGVSRARRSRVSKPSSATTTTRGSGWEIAISRPTCTRPAPARRSHALHGDGRDRRQMDLAVPTAADDRRPGANADHRRGGRAQPASCTSGVVRAERAHHRSSRFVRRRDRVASRSRRARGDRGRRRDLAVPSNPVISIGPILAVPGIPDALVARRDGSSASRRSSEAHPFRDRRRLMAPLGMEVSCVGVARAYAPFCSTLVIDAVDEGRADEVEAAGVRAVVADTHDAHPRDRGRARARDPRSHRRPDLQSCPAR